MKNKFLPENPNKNATYEAGALREIYVAGGCFWGVDAYMRRVPGVARTEAGYANGHVESPTYERVCQGDSGHAEAVRVWYDPARVTAGQLAAQLFSVIDSTSKNRQGGDVGDQYRTGVYYTDPADLPGLEAAFVAERTKQKKPVVTELMPIARYYPAEEYHQDYLEKNPDGYCHISFDGLCK